MTKDKIISMLRKADAAHDTVVVTPFLERFAVLVATAERRKLQADIERWKAERQPLTKEQQFFVWSKLFGPNKDRLNSPYNSYIAHDSFYKVVAAIEAANCITGGQR